MMKFKWFVILVGVLSLAALPALAQDTGANSVTFNGMGFQFDSALATNVNIRQFPGDPTDLEQPGGPEVAHTEFMLFNGMDTPAGWFDGVGAVRFYNSVDFAGYEFPSAELQSLQTLLADRPDLNQYMVASEDASTQLPFMPVFPASQVIRGQAHYVDTPELAGVAYLTVYRQDVSPFVANEFFYTFQGLSNDGATYVSATFRANVPAFPTEIPADFDYDTFSAGYMDYLAESIALLNSAAPGDVTPNINTLDALVQSITLSGGGSVQPAPGDVATVAPATEDAGQTNGTAGALQGTWRLTAYGDPANPTPVAEGSEVTAVFEPGGLGGSAGCNTYGGSFQFEGQTLTVSNVVSTLRACEDQAVMTQETTYLDALGRVTAYQVEGSTLRLTYPEGVLVFEAV